MPWRRMDHQARRLVHNQEMVVFVENIERNFFRMRAGRVHRREGNGDLIAGREPMGDLRALPVDLDAAGADDLAKLDAAVFWQLVREKRVETLAGRGGAHDESQRLLGRDVRGGQGSEVGGQRSECYEL